MTKISLVEILTLLIVTIILLIALFSATFDGGEFINFKFNKIFGKGPFSVVNAYVGDSGMDENTISLE